MWTVEALSQAVNHCLAGWQRLVFNLRYKNVITAGNTFFFSSLRYSLCILGGDPLSETEQTAARTAYGMLV